MTTQKVCIVGGGAAGASLLWCLSQDAQAREQWQMTLIHDQPDLGGHSLAFPVQRNGKTFNIDIGVQFISPMLYPNVHVMLQKPEFQQVQVVDYDSLNIACAFPRDINDQPQNWGNFADYQQGSDFAMFDEDMQFDAAAFMAFIEVAIVDGWAGKTIQAFFDEAPVALRNPERFANFLLAPYLSIINGYGNALMNETLFGELIPMFAKIPLVPKTPLGSLLAPGTGWQRFAEGASSWVRAMASVAQSNAPANINIITNAPAQAVWTDEAGMVHVQWQVSGASEPTEDVFDRVVLTADMWTNSKLLNNASNQTLWPTYEPCIGLPAPNCQPAADDAVWPLMWGRCYIHTDSSMLSPDLQQQEETLQFNAYYAPSNDDIGYELSKTFTTYIQKNVLQDQDADGLYLTMYGYCPDPGTDKVPDPSKVLYQQDWTHGKWTPGFMSGAKAQLHTIQGLGNVWFAGNNATTDSEEGALALAMYYIYDHVMFPNAGAGSRIADLMKLAA
jgi:hypothetical protein